MKIHGKLNRHVIFESVLTPFAKKIIEISPCLSKLQLAKIDTFLLRHSVQCLISRMFNIVHEKYKIQT